MSKMGRIRLSILRTGMAVVDAGLVLLSLLAAIWLRFDDKSLSWMVMNYLDGHLIPLLVFAVGCTVLLRLLNMYRYAWLHAGLEAVQSLLIASFIWTAALVLVQTAIFGRMLPRSSVMIFWLISTMTVGSLRVFFRIHIRRLQKRALSTGSCDKGFDSARRTRALVVGNADYAVGIIKAISRTSGLRHYDIIGILDGNPGHYGMLYSGVEVLGTPQMLIGFLKEMPVDVVIFALSDDMDGADIRQHVLNCRQRKIPAKVVPNFTESLTKPNHVRLEDIKVEDLLRRPMRSVDLHSFDQYITGRRVLVTGAGGSIGAGICRQLITAKPAELILLGHGENSIFRIQQELIRNYPESATRISSVIASTTSEERLDGIFREFKPDVVFHSAAHKHVPLMESNVCEAVCNNVIGTYVLAQACVRHGVKKVVHISTDKAADPSSVMGATKYLCECLIKAAAAEQTGTGFVCVRFGNVLGSRGSVIPVFAAQIENGGPVTVTDPEMTRYFMTIPEAVRLVIQAGSIGRSGELYLLDMGKPVKILDLAEDMIRLNGLEPYVDIPIIFTGIRPGEKMHEQLISASEQIESSGYDGLNRVNSSSAYSWSENTQLVLQLRAMAAGMNSREVLMAFEQCIPGYCAGAGAVLGRLVS